MPHYKHQTIPNTRQGKFKKKMNEQQVTPDKCAAWPPPH